MDECKPLLDGRRLATASRDRTARVWDISTRREVAKLEGRCLHSSFQLNLSRFCHDILTPPSVCHKKVCNDEPKSGRV